MTSSPYLVRTHELLGHFETLPTPLITQTASTSASTTPQQNARMTLRNRGRPAQGDDQSPVMARQAMRGTPRPKDATTVYETPEKQKRAEAVSSVKLDHLPVEVGQTLGTSDTVKVKLEAKQYVQESGQPDSIADADLNTLKPSGREENTSLKDTVLSHGQNDSVATLEFQAVPLGSQSVESSHPKIMLRIPRRSPSPLPTAQSQPDSPQWSKSPPSIITTTDSTGTGSGIHSRDGSEGIKSTYTGSEPGTTYMSAISELSDTERESVAINTRTNGVLDMSEIKTHGTVKPLISADLGNHANHQEM